MSPERQNVRILFLEQEVYKKGIKTVKFLLNFDGRDHVGFTCFNDEEKDGPSPGEETKTLNYSEHR